MTEFNLSNHHWTTPKGDGFEFEAIREFIQRRITDIEQEQKIAKGNDWKRSLLLLKANLEEDSGSKLTK